MRQVVYGAFVSAVQEQFGPRKTIDADVAAPCLPCVPPGPHFWRNGMVQTLVQCVPEHVLPPVHALLP